MSPSALQLAVLGVAILIAAVFVASFRFALRECSGGPGRGAADLPRAEIRHGGARWTVGARKQRAMSNLRFLQAGFVAMGITSIFVMVVCAVGIVVLMIAS